MTASDDPGEEAAAGVPSGSSVLERHRNHLRVHARVNLAPFLRAKIDASDIVQEALVAAVKSDCAFERWEESAVRGFLVRCLNSVLANTLRAYRTGKRDVALEMPYDFHRSSIGLDRWLGASYRSPDDWVEHEETRRALCDALDALEPFERATVVLRYWQGMKTPAIAATTGLSPEEVNSHARRALAILRRSLTHLDR